MDTRQLSCSWQRPTCSINSAMSPTSANRNIRSHVSAPPVPVPAGHVGPLALPGTGRMVWWTGRVAIGLLHRPERRHEPLSRSALWLQELMLGARRADVAATRIAAG